MGSQEDTSPPRRTERLFIGVTPAEHTYALAEATARGQKLSEAVREALRKDGLLPKPAPREDGGGR